MVLNKLKNQKNKNCFFSSFSSLKDNYEKNNLTDKNGQSLFT